jgi:hypothetical protein
MATAQDLLRWLLLRGYYVDWRRDKWLAVDWYAALNPYVQNRMTHEGMEDLAVKASSELKATVTYVYRASPAYVSFKGEAIDGDTKKGGRRLSEMHTLVLWNDKGHTLCHVIIMFNE